MPQKKSAVGQNIVTIHRDTDAQGNMKAWYTVSDGYDGVDVSIAIDHDYHGGSFEVPPEQADHIYVIVGPVAIGIYSPSDANAIVFINCAGGPG